MTLTTSTIRWMTAVAVGGVFTVGACFWSGTSSARVQSAGVVLKMIAHQAGCAVALVATTSTTESLYAKATVHNGGTQAIRTVTFAVVLHREDGTSRPVMIQGLSLPTAIEPGAALDLEPSVDASAMGRQLRAWPDGAIAQLGLLRVEFEDGTAWDSSARVQRHFGMARAARTSSRSCGPRPWLSEVAHAMGVDDGGGYFKCGGTDESLYCSNNLSSCSIAACSDPSACAKQLCVFVQQD